MTATSREHAPDAFGASMTAKAHPCHGLIIGLRIAIIATRPPLFAPIAIPAEAADDFRIVAEFIAVLRT